MWALVAVVSTGMFQEEARAFGKKRKTPANDGTQLTPTPHGELRLRVLSYNVKGLPLPTLDHSRYRDIGKILAERRRAGTAPHIVAIQEGFHDRVQELIAEAGYPHVRQGPRGASARFNGGIWILSEYPIVSDSHIVFEHCVSYDCLVRKGAQFTRVIIPGLPHPLEVLNTHMNSDPDGDPSVTYQQCADARLTQVQEIREFMWEKRQSQAPAIFPGDFNFRAGDDEYVSHESFSMMLNAGGRCARSRRCTGDADFEQDWRTSVDHQFYVGGYGPYVTIEPTHYERNFREKVAGRELSDHFGLEVHYRISW